MIAERINRIAGRTIVKAGRLLEFAVTFFIAGRTNRIAGRIIGKADTLLLFAGTLSIRAQSIQLIKQKADGKNHCFHLLSFF